MTTTDYKGFFKSLFDFNFTSLITSRLVKVLYILVTVLYSLMALFFLIEGLSHGVVDALLAIIFVPVVWLVYMIGARVFLEVLIVVFRIEEDLRGIGRSLVAPTPGGVSPFHASSPGVGSQGPIGGPGSGLFANPTPPPGPAGPGASSWGSAPGEAQS